jgi:hypothetical protein
MPKWTGSLKLDAILSCLKTHSLIYLIFSSIVDIGESGVMQFLDSRYLLISSIWNSNVAMILGWWASIIFYASFLSFSFNKSSIIFAWVNAPPFLSFAKLRSQPRLVLLEWVDPWWLPSLKILEAAWSFSYRLTRS